MLQNRKRLLATVTAFDNQPGWKMNAEGTHVEIKDGNPVFIGTDGKEMVVKGDTLSSLRGEAQGHRTKYEEILAKYKPFEGLDPSKVTSAMELVGKIDQKTLIEAGKVDEVKRQITEQFTAQISEKDKAYNEISGKYGNMLVNNVFANSEFVRNNLAVPRDMFEATFRSNFKVENDQVVVYDKAGNRLMSKKNVGEYATPDEALEILVEAHPQKDVILKANSGNGSGNAGNGGNSGNGRIVKRSDLERMSPAMAAETAKKAASGEIKIVD